MSTQSARHPAEPKLANASPQKADQRISEKNTTSASLMNTTPCNAISCMVIGLGMPAQSDASVGLVLAQHLKTQYPKLLVNFNQTNREQLVNDLNKAELIIILDAMEASHLNPGTMRLANLTQSTEPLAAFRHSNALVSVCQALELARMLGQPHAELWALGIAGHCFTPGEALSQSVTQVIEQASRQVLDFIKLHAPSVYQSIQPVTVE